MTPFPKPTRKATGTNTAAGTAYENDVADDLEQAYSYWCFRSVGSRGSADVFALNPLAKDPEMRMLLVQCKHSKDGRPGLPKNERMALEDLAAFFGCTAVYAHNVRGAHIIYENVNTGGLLW